MANFLMNEEPASDGEAAIAVSDAAAATPARMEESAAPAPMKKKARTKNGMVQWPEQISPYAPGEGYGSNVLPFVGVAPKSLKRRQSERGKIEVLRLMEEAMDPRRLQRIQEMRERSFVSQSLPVPEDLLPEIREGGWLEAAATAVEGEECEIEIDDEVFEDQGMRWQHVRFTGSPDAVSKGKMTLMSGLAPPRVELL